MYPGVGNIEPDELLFRLEGAMSFEARSKLRKKNKKKRKVIHGEYVSAEPTTPDSSGPKEISLSAQKSSEGTRPSTPVNPCKLDLPTYKDVEAASERLKGVSHKTPVMTS